MTYATANGFRVLGGEIVVPLSGAWRADLELDTETAPTGAVTVELEDGTTLKGFARRGKAHGGSTGVRLVGGAGGLAKTIPSKHHRRPSKSLVASDICSAAGETLLSTSALDGDLPAWSRIEGTAGEALSRLAEELGVLWRVTLAGEVTFSAATWPDSGLAELDVIDRDAALATAEVSRFVEPGKSLLGERVTLSTIRFTKSGADYFVQLGEAGASDAASPADRLKGLVASLVRSILGSRVDYLARYACIVVQQDAAGLLELKPDDPRIPSLQGIPIGLGLPGARVKVPKGARVLLTWRDGDPSQPIAELWESGTGMTEIAFDGGAAGVARVGDVVNLTLLPGVHVFAVPASSVGPFTFSPLAPINVTGTILTGSTKVKA